MDRTETLATLVEHDPSRAIALDRLGLDYCCNGDRTVEEACARAGLDPSVVEAALDAPAGTPGVHDCAGMAPADLVAHVLEHHHEYLHRELRELAGLADRVVAAHETRHPELVQVRALVTLLTDDLEPHMAKEERVLFPAIVRLGEGASDFPFGSIANPIRMMTAEHERAGSLLEELRALTDAYGVPDDGCASYRLLYERLEYLEHDTHVHIYEENHLLFPKAVAIEAARA